MKIAVKTGTLLTDHHWVFYTSDIELETWRHMTVSTETQVSSGHYEIESYYNSYPVGNTDQPCLVAGALSATESFVHYGDFRTRNRRLNSDHSFFSVTFIGDSNSEIENCFLRSVARHFIEKFSEGTLHDFLQSCLVLHDDNKSFSVKQDILSIGHNTVISAEDIKKTVRKPSTLVVTQNDLASRGRLSEYLNAIDVFKLPLHSSASPRLQQFPAPVILVADKSVTRTTFAAINKDELHFVLTNNTIIDVIESNTGKFRRNGEVSKENREQKLIIKVLLPPLIKLKKGWDNFLAPSCGPAGYPRSADKESESRGLERENTSIIQDNTRLGCEGRSDTDK